MKGEKLKVKSCDLKMVDIGEKPPTKRMAVAQGKVYMKKATLDRLIKNKIPKGDVLTCAKIAGIMAAKKTHQLLPLCHPLAIDSVDLCFKVNPRDNFVTVASSVSSFGKTGVEMEALTAVSIASLTIYDMCKMLDRDIRIEDIKLIKKLGGKSGTYIRKD